MKLRQIFIIGLLITGLGACKKQLDIKNPNQPTTDAANSEQGIVSLAQGSIYINGFTQVKYGETGYLAFAATGIHDVMGDIVGGEAANAYLNQIGCPYQVILDDGSVVLNPNSPKEQIELIRNINTNANQGENVLYYEWAFMYNLIASANSILDGAEKVEFTSDADTKKAVLQAWSYWWKGYAYSRIGSIYYAGIINDAPFKTNGKYVTKEQIIAESNANLDKAAGILGSIPSLDAYTTFLGKIIPSFFQVGKGGVPTPDMWKRNINTLKARNILVNKKASELTAAEWGSILSLVNSGITSSDNVFTGRSNANGDFISGTTTISGKTQSTKAGGNTYKLSERWVQEFKTGDKRLANNVALTTTWIGNSDRGNSFNTRYALVNGGNAMSGVVVYANTDPGAYELYIAGTYEENELMKAEAKIYTNDVEGGLALIDAVRKNQGAGLPAVAGTSLTLAQAKEELRRERRVTLAFRGLAFYDARRWGVIDALTDGGGRKNAVVVTNAGVVNTKATIEYKFLDYWDVPDNELAYNPPAEGSADVKNPK